MSDKEIVEALINRDNDVTRHFLFESCRPLFRSIIKYVFSYDVDYDEFVNELYQELIKDDARKLRQFDYRSTIYQWLKTVAIRYFINKRDSVIEDCSKDPLLPIEEIDDSASRDSARMDLEKLFDAMPNKRYVYVLQKLQLEDMDPKDLADELQITVDNLYNIKKRAMAALSQIALNDKKSYGRFKVV